MSSPPAQSHTHFPHTLLDAQHNLDEEISRLETHLISLKLARNALSAISQLHPEILQEIFFLTHISSEQFSKGKASLTLTWVSHTWRDLAKRTSDLWIYVDFNHSEWRQAAISLARDRELSLDLDFTSQNGWRDWYTFGPLHLSNLYRTKTLEIHSTFRVSVRLYLEAIPEWANPAPTLTGLTLNCISIPSTIFSGICPRLESLHLMACKMDWATLPVLLAGSTLKELDISMPDQEIPVNHFIWILQSLAPTLQWLKLCNLLVVNSESSTPDVELVQVDLKNLKGLSIYEDDPNPIKEFLTQISFPRHTDTEIRTTWDLAVIEALASSKDISGWETDRLEVDVSISGNIVLRVRKTGSDLKLKTSHFVDVDVIGDNANLTNIQHNNVALPTTTTSNLLAPFPSPIDVDDPPIQTIEDQFFFSNAGNLRWLDYFSQLTTIHKVRFDKYFINSFTFYINAQIHELHSTLLGGDHMDLADGDTPGPGPGLELDQATKLRGQSIISFHDLRTLEIHDGMTSTSMLSFTEDDVNSLRRWLEWRNKLGVRLNRLILVEVVESASWAHEVFDEVVDELELVDGTVKEHWEADDAGGVEGVAGSDGVE